MYILNCFAKISKVAQKKGTPGSKQGSINNINGCEVFILILYTSFMTEFDKIPAIILCIEDIYYLHTYVDFRQIT